MANQSWQRMRQTREGSRRNGPDNMGLGWYLAEIWGPRSKGNGGYVSMEGELLDRSL